MQNMSSEKRLPELHLDPVLGTVIGKGYERLSREQGLRRG